MKKICLLLLTVLISTVSIAQKKEKIKGSKKVTTVQQEIKNFKILEVEDNLEIYLQKGEKSELKIEADDNLHEIIVVESTDDRLRIHTKKLANSFKKLIVRITYTDQLTLVKSKNEAMITAIEEVTLNDITFESLDLSKLYLNINSKNFTLKANDETTAEINVKSENSIIELSKEAQLKGLIAAVKLKCDLYQKSEATLEGDVTNAIIRLDNNAQLIASKLTNTTLNLIAEGYSKGSINAQETISLKVVDNTEIELYGAPKIEITAFNGEAKLAKKIK